MWPRVTLSVIASVLIGWLASASRIPPPSEPQPVPVPNSSASGDRSATAGVCEYDEAKAIAEAFLDAYNRGDSRTLAQFFGEKFQWWSATNPHEPHFVAYRPDMALAYFERRHAEGEHLTLREFHLSDPTGRPPRDVVNFSFNLDRTFQNNTLLVVGKGAMDCEAREIFVWSMGSPA